MQTKMFASFPTLPLTFHSDTLVWYLSHISPTRITNALAMIRERITGFLRLVHIGKCRDAHRYHLRMTLREILFPSWKSPALYVHFPFIATAV